MLDPADAMVFFGEQIADGYNISEEQFAILDR